VSASVVAVTPTTSRLVFTSTTTGSANAISLQDIGGTLLNSIGLGAGVIAARTLSTATTGGYAYTAVASLDANFSLDGVDIIRGTNNVNDVISGLTIQLKATQLSTDQPITLTVSADNDTIRSRVNDFITSYNDALSIVTAKTSVDPTNNVRQILAGDGVFLGLRMRLRTTIAGVVSSVQSGNPSLLSQIGITAAADGSLSISDTAKFDEMVSTNPSAVTDLFSSSGGVATQLNTLLNGFVSVSGVIQTTSDSISSQVTYLTDRITKGDDIISKKADAFRDQYARVQSTLQMLTEQQQFINSIVQSMLTSTG